MLRSLIRRREHQRFAGRSSKIHAEHGIPGTRSMSDVHSTAFRSSTVVLFAASVSMLGVRGFQLCLKMDR